MRHHPACRTRAGQRGRARARRGGLDHPAPAVDQLLARRHPGNRARGLGRRLVVADRAVREGPPGRQPDQRAKGRAAVVSRRIKTDAACPAHHQRRARVRGGAGCAARCAAGCCGFDANAPEVSAISRGCGRARGGTSLRAWAAARLQRAVIAQPHRRRLGVRQRNVPPLGESGGVGGGRGRRPRRRPTGVGAPRGKVRLSRRAVRSAPPHRRAPGGASRRSSSISRKRRPTLSEASARSRARGEGTATGAPPLGGPGGHSDWASRPRHHHSPSWRRHRPQRLQSGLGGRALAAACRRRAPVPQGRSRIVYGGGEDPLCLPGRRARARRKALRPTPARCSKPSIGGDRPRRSWSRKQSTGHSGHRRHDPLSTCCASGSDQWRSQRHVAADPSGPRTPAGVQGRAACSSRLTW